MPFLAKLDLDPAGETRATRRLLAHRLDALLIGHEHRFDIIIHNMSETGFLAEFASELRVGDEVRLCLSRLGFVPARVVWKRGSGHGCEFVERIPLDVIEQTIAASVGIGPQPTDRERAEREALSAERIGLRRRAVRERLGTLVALGCLLLAIVILAAALISIMVG